MQTQVHDNLPAAIWPHLGTTTVPISKPLLFLNGSTVNRYACINSKIIEGRDYLEVFFYNSVKPRSRVSILSDIELCCA